MQTSDTPPWLVLGLGSVLMRDDGVGIHVIHRLKEKALPAEVEVLEGGTLGLSLLGYLENRKKIVIVDAMDAGERPGNLFRMTLEDMQGMIHGGLGSFHQLDLHGIFKIFGCMQARLPDVVIIAVQPKELAPGMQLSAEVEDKLSSAVDLVMAELQLPRNSGAGG